MLYSGEQILSFKPSLLFYAEDFLKIVIPVNIGKYEFFKSTNGCNCENYDLDISNARDENIFDDIENEINQPIT